MLLLRARILSTYQLPVREGHPTPVGMVHLLDQSQDLALKLPAVPEAYARLSALEPMTEVILEITLREIDLGRTGPHRGRAHRLRIARVRGTQGSPDATPG